MSSSRDPLGNGREASMARPLRDSYGDLLECGSARSQLLQKTWVGIHPEARALGHRDPALLRLDGLAQWILREIAVEALDERLVGQGRDAVDRRERDGALLSHP